MEKSKIWVSGWLHQVFATIFALILIYSPRPNITVGGVFLAASLIIGAMRSIEKQRRDIRP